MPSLTWIRPVGRPKVFSVWKKLTTIGGAGGNDIEIEGSGLAEHHAQLVFDGRGFNLNEVDRDAKILINGKPKRRAPVQHADRITLGHVELTFSVFDEESAQEPNDASTPRAELGGLRKLHELSQRLMESHSLPEQLEQLIDAVLAATHAAKGFLVLFENGSTKISVARHLAGRPLPEDEQLLSDSIVRRVIETKLPLIVSDAVNDTIWKGAESVMNLQVASVMCAPLVSQGTLLGLIYVGNDAVRGLFEESSLDVLTIFAGQASLILQNAILLDQLKTDRDHLEQQLNEKSFGDLVGTNASLVEVFRKVERVATTDISVLITGETGTGKELIAREVHRRSPRRERPFVVVNCGAIPENLMESELFGHARGAFTGAIATRQGKFQAAHGGTLFLDEIGEMPLSLQVKLLRALQEKIVMKVGETKPERVDIRVVAATNRDLDDEIRKGAFREDLFYRLNVVNLHLPPLRERGDDVLVLAKFFLSKYAEELNPKVKGFTPNALIAIRKYEWPGNIRQLENRMRKAIVLCDKTLIGPEDLDLYPEVLAPIMTLAQAREEFQRRYILEVLERNNGNRTKTARDLGVDPRTIFRYLEDLPDAPEPGSPTGT
jgi:transcriptional regulator with GAF, ATPase, and Fis domain